ncbi:ribbon-helix-helix domain-containing protein [Ralstonia pseudosolanacearum]
MTAAKALRERCHNGASERVIVNVEPEVLADLKARAENEGRSLSNMTRFFIIRGMTADRPQRSHGAAQRHTTSVVEG